MSEEQPDESAKVIEFPKERIVKWPQSQQDADELLRQISFLILTFFSRRRKR